MTRIALMTNCVSRAGAETQMVRLAIELRRRGHQVGVLSIVSPLAFTQTLAEADIPLITLAPDDPASQRILKVSVLRGIRPAVRILRRWRTEALLCFVHEASLFGRLAGRLAGVPVIIGSERNIWREGRLDRVLSRLSDRLLSVTVANAPQVAADLIARRVVPPDRVVVIPNGIDVASYERAPERRAEVRNALGMGADFVWLAVGRLEPQKDYPLLLSAFAAVLARRGDTRLLVAGEGTLRGDLEALAQRLRIDHRVVFLGERDDIADLLAGADALAMSSESEGLPNAVMEAFAAGRPVVATAVGGVPELVVPGVTGLLVQSREAAAFADAMERLITASPHERRVMGDAGRQLVREHFDTPRVTSAWMDLIVARQAPGVARTRTRIGSSWHGFTSFRSETQ